MQIKNFSVESFPFKFLAGSIPVLLGVYLAINPFPHKTAIENICFYASVLFVLILVGARKMTFHFRNPLSLSFALFAAWSFIGLFFALDRGNSIHDFYAHLVQYVIFLYLLVNFFHSEKYVSYLIWIVIASSTVFALWVMIYFYGIQGYPLSTKLGLESIDELSSNIIGTLTLFPMILSLGWLIRGKDHYRKAISFVCLVILAVATMATMARSALLAMAIALMIMLPLLMKNRRFFILLFVFFAVALIAMPVRGRFTPSNLIEKLQATDRFNIALTYIEIVKDYPLIGIGFGMQAYGEDGLLNKYNSRLPVQYRQPVPAKAPHNILIDIAVRTGLLGLCFFLYIAFSFVKMGRRLIKNGRSPFLKECGLCLLAAFAAIFIQGLFENTLSGPPAIILYTIMGMMTILWRLDQAAKANQETIDTLVLHTD
jgi:O-Antigen ligase